MFHASRTAAVALGLFLTIASSARGQSTAQIPLQFDFMNPGARSLGLGGAFVAAADDATAAFANPSGLAFLTTPEVSFEGRHRRIDTPFLQGGRISGNITGKGPDIVPRAVYATDVDREFGPTFLSFVMPFDRITVAAYRHEVATIDNTFFSEGTFYRSTVNGVTDDANRDTALGGRRTIAIRNYGGAFGYKVSDTFAFGVGLSAYTFDVRSDFTRYGLVSDIYGNIDRRQILATNTQRGQDASVAGNAGLLWSVGRGVKVAGMFRRGPRFAFVQDDRDFTSDHAVHRSGRFKVPDVWGGGIEWRVADSWRVVGDYTRVAYGQLEEDFIDFQAISSGRQAQLRIDDGHEVHVGAERLFLGTPLPLAVRLGAWFDPDHAVRYTPTAQNDETDVRFAATLPGGTNLFHYTAGGGIVLTRWIELNAAVDLSSKTTYATASVVVRFR